MSDVYGGGKVGDPMVWLHTNLLLQHVANNNTCSHRISQFLFPIHQNLLILAQAYTINTATMAPIHMWITGGGGGVLLLNITRYYW